MNSSILNEIKLEDRDKLASLKIEIAQIENLILIGELAEIISHEIRNPMTTVRGFLQIFLEKPSLATNPDFLKLMIEELDSVNSIISGFLSVSESAERTTELHSLNNIIKLISPLIRVIGTNEEKYFEVDLNEIPEIYININEIRYLIFNMCRNAYEAMDKGGTLTISTKMEENWVLLEIRDEGKGIDPIVLGKLGTPFITTKEKGTGLGLSVCYSIVKRHNASIQVKTNDLGTSFTIRFVIPDATSDKG